MRWKNPPTKHGLLLRGRKVVVRQGFGGMRLLACRLGLFAARHRVQYIPFLVNHAQFQCLFAGRYNGETRFGAAEYGPFDGLHLAGERTGRIGDIVDVAACHAYVLEVVDVPADVHIHLVLAQDGIETCLHIRAFALVLRGFGIDGMVSGNDNPVLFGGSQYGIYPGKLLLVILLAGIGIGLAVVAVFVNHRGGVYPKDADGSAVVLERLGVITGGHGPAAADITIVEHSLRITAVFVVASRGNQSIISSGWL